MYVELKDVINAAGGDWILEAQWDGDDNEAFLAKCVELMLREGTRTESIKFLRGIADSLENSMPCTCPSGDRLKLEYALYHATRGEEGSIHG